MLEILVVGFKVFFSVNLLKSAPLSKIYIYSERGEAGASFYDENATSKFSSEYKDSKVL
jgi:hypothetical protein